MAKKSIIPKIISGILATILIAGASYILLPPIWFWIGFEVLAASLVTAGCGGEWYLHHHPAGRKKVQKEEHHNLESIFIALVFAGVFMEFFGLAHAIPEAMRLEKDVALANERSAIANKLAGDANERAATNELTSKRLELQNLLLHKEVADANERVAKAEKETAELYARVQPRRITAEQGTNIIVQLAKWQLETNKCLVFLDCEYGDAEARVLGQQIYAILRLSGFEVTFAAPVSVFDARAPIAFGIFFNVKSDLPPPPSAADIIDAFFSNTSFKITPRNSQRVTNDNLYIHIGPKPFD